MVKIPGLSKVQSVSSVLVAEKDHAVFPIAHPKHLTLFASPLAPDGEKSRRTHSVLAHHKIRHAEEGDPQYSLSSEHVHHFQDPNEPALRHAEESSVIELFYDLFFVANLTTFTGVHEINDADSLKSYIGFFAILWFTWFQVALFDVRFGSDSLFERLCKALQFGIMTGFAIAGPGYLTGVEGDDAVKAVQTFKTLSLILMASRLILVVQYGVVLLFLRQFSKARLPLFIHMAVLLAASMVYLGIFFAFYFNANTGYTLIAWYIAIGFEALAILLVSAQVKFITLRKTYIVERLGLLTLIILGEGVIGICASINKVGSDRSFSSDVIGMIISSIGIIYFLWMMYFDQSETKHVGTIRQQFWTICHFPFHAAVLLTVEGVAQFSVWRKVLDVINQWETNVYQAANYPTNGNTTIMVEYLNQTINALYEQFPASKAPYMDFTGDFQALQNSSLSNDTLQDVLGDIDYNGIVYIATSFGIEPPKKFEDPSEDQLEGISETFEAVFLYFFAAAGLALVFMAILFFLGKRYKVRGDYVSIAVRVLVGVGLGLLTLMDLTSSAENAYANYAGGPWLLPTVVLAYGFVVLVDHVIITCVRSVVRRRRERDQAPPGGKPVPLFMRPIYSRETGNVSYGHAL